MCWTSGLHFFFFSLEQEDEVAAGGLECHQAINIKTRSESLFVVYIFFFIYLCGTGGKESLVEYHFILTIKIAV